MKTFKTPKGTELPFLNLKGKDYLQVAHRLVWFREEHKNASIETDFIKLEENYAIAKAVISFGNGETMAVAHGREDAKHFPDFIEKAETKAIGRALALCGYGTQFAPELDEGERLADAPLPPRQYTQAPKILEPQTMQAPIYGATTMIKPLAEVKEPEENTNELRREVSVLMKKFGLTTETVRAMAEKLCGKKTTYSMNVGELKALIGQINESMKK